MIKSLTECENMKRKVLSELKMLFVLLCSLVSCDKANGQTIITSSDSDSVIVNQLFNDTKDCLINCFDIYKMDSLRVLVTDDNYDIISGGIWKNTKGTMSSSLYGPKKIMKTSFTETHVLPMIDYYDSYNTEEHRLVVDSDSIGWMKIIPLTDTSIQKVIWGMPGGKRGTYSILLELFSSHSNNQDNDAVDFICKRLYTIYSKFKKEESDDLWIDE